MLVLGQVGTGRDVEVAAVALRVWVGVVLWNGERAIRVAIPKVEAHAVRGHQPARGAICHWADAAAFTVSLEVGCVVLQVLNVEVDGRFHPVKAL